MMRQLIKTSGGKMYFSLHRFAQYTGVGHAAIVVYIGITRIKRDGIDSMLLLHRSDFLGHCIKSFLPANFYPLTTLTLNRFAQTVWVGEDILHCRAFRADIATA